jgi:hypothetical protein
MQANFIDVAAFLHGPPHLTEQSEVAMTLLDRPAVGQRIDSFLSASGGSKGCPDCAQLVDRDSARLPMIPDSNGILRMCLRQRRIEAIPAD